MRLIADNSFEARNLGPEWVETTNGKHLNKVVDEQGREPSADFNGRLVRIVSKKEHCFSETDRAARGFLAVLALIFSLGLAYLSKSIQDLLHKSKESVYLSQPVEKRSTSDDEDHSSKDPLANGDGPKASSIGSGEAPSFKDPLISGDSSKAPSISKYDACSLIAKGKFNEFQECLNNGLNPAEEIWSGEVPLHWAVKRGLLEIAELLIDHSRKVNGEVNEINAQSKYKNHPHAAGRTPLSMISDNLEVTEETRTKIIDLLLSNGADANIPDNAGKLPLHYAVTQSYIKNGRNIDSIRTLIEHTNDINAIDDSGFSALALAVYLHQPAIINLLLEHGASVDALLNIKGGYSLMHLAVCGHGERGDVGIMKILLDKCSDIPTQINLPNDEGLTPLHLAATLGNLEMTKLLIARGANTNIKNKKGQLPLEVAREMKNKLRNPGEGRAAFAAAFNAHLIPKLEEIISILESSEKIIELKIGPQAQLLLLNKLTQQI